MLLRKQMNNLTDIEVENVVCILEKKPKYKWMRDTINDFKRKGRWGNE